MNMGGDGADALGDDGEYYSTCIYTFWTHLCVCMDWYHNFFSKMEWAEIFLSKSLNCCIRLAENEDIDTEEEDENVEEKHSAEKKEAAPAAVPAEESNAQKAWSFQIQCVVII